MSILTPVDMPHYGAYSFPDDRYYVFKRQTGKLEPSLRSRALRAFWKKSDAFQWARTNLDNFSIISNR